MADIAINVPERIAQAFNSLENILSSHDIDNCNEFGTAEKGTFEYALHKDLKRLVAGGNICKAEDKLFDGLKAHLTPMCLKAAYIFYRDINALSDEQLKKCGFSRREVLDGMWDAEHVFMMHEDSVG